MRSNRLKLARFEIQVSQRTVVFMILIVAPIAIMASLPLIAHTSTYPIAIVDGSSMYPALHNGDLIYYSTPKSPVKNGTIIVFIQGDSGVSSFDALLKPIVIHRVVGFGYQSDGSLYYETKGDNNAAADPFVTPASSILGVETSDVPYLGLPIQFLKTAYGMLTVVSVMSLYFFSGVDTRIWMEDQRKRLLTVFAGHSLDGSLGSEQFEKLKTIIECSDIPGELLKDTNLVSLLQWLKTGGLSEKWREEKGTCPKCGSVSYKIIGEDESFVVCPTCMPYSRDIPRRALSANLTARNETASHHTPQQFLPQRRAQCGTFCSTHDEPCNLQRGHLRSHHHVTRGGRFCSFD